MPPYDFIGVMRPDKFIDELLDIAGRPIEQPPAVDFSAVPSEDAEEMCEEFVRAAKDSKICPGFHLFITRPRKSTEAQPSGFKVRGTNADEECDNLSDIEPAIGVRKQPDRRRGARVQPKKKGFNDYYDFAAGQLGIEVLSDVEDDPFMDPSDYIHSDSGSHSKPPCFSKGRPLQRFTLWGKESCRSLMSRAQAHFLRQHRCHFFQIVLIGSEARFLRWDHAGAAVSQRFSYVEQPELVARFFWRFAHMTDSQRGWDATVTRPSRQEVALFATAVRAFLADMEQDPEDGAPVRQLSKARCTLDESTGTFPTWKVRVTNEVAATSTDLIIRRPFTFNENVFSRATRAYIAYDLQAQRLVFFKDSWRSMSANAHPEFETTLKLQEHGVPNVPVALYGGDIYDMGEDGLRGPPHRTASKDLLKDPELWHHPDIHISEGRHHRMVQDIAYPLDGTVSERDFVQALLDALIAMEKAHSTMGLAHRDISAGNIMLTADGRGLLIDWEHAGYDSEKSTWVGTWAFASVRIGRDHRATRSLRDDLESIFWLLAWGGFSHYTPWGGPYMLRHFSAIEHDASGYEHCGREKARWVQQGVEWHFSSGAFQDLVWCANRAWVAVYAAEKEKAAGGKGPERPDDEVQSEDAPCLEQASEPAFWIDMFAEALEELDDEAEELAHEEGRVVPRVVKPRPKKRAAPPTPIPTTPKAHATRAKRKAAAAALKLERMGGYGPECPRRSKRRRIETLN